MMIQVTRFFQDVQGHKVYPGVYDLGSPKLQGLGEQLVKDGFAIELKEMDSTDVEVIPGEVVETGSEVHEGDVVGGFIDDDEPRTSYQDASGREAEFTHHASSLMDEHGITQQDMLDYFPDNDKLSKADVEQYIEETVD